MKLRIYGQNKKVAREELRLAVEIMLPRLLSDQMLRHITIYIRQQYSLRLGKVPVYAFVRIRGEKYPPRDFTIWLDTKQGKRSQLRSIAHELTHVKQYAKGEARTLKNGMVRWKDTHCKHSYSFFTPWEVDATGYEDAIYYSYRDVIQKLKTRGTGRSRAPRRSR